MKKTGIKSMNETIKTWYQENFPTDELGEDLNQKATFWDLFYQLDARKCVYRLMEVNDSIVRERLFKHLAELMDVSYDYVYDQRLLGA